MSSTLVQTLRERQGTESDKEFAARLGVSREMWRLIRTGKKPPGRRTLDGVVVAFPDLRDAVQSVLLPRSANLDATTASELARKENGDGDEPA